MARRETRDFDVISKGGRILSDRSRIPRRFGLLLLCRRTKAVYMAGEKLLLIVVTRRPGQHIADVKSLALDLPEHDFWNHAFIRTLIVRASGSVNVTISGVIAMPMGLNPTLER